MKWVTRERPKIDRIACPWLIARFIDDAPEFLYVPTDRGLAVAEETGAIPYDIPDVELSHGGDQCSFDAFLVKYDLRDHALLAMAAIVRGADTSRLDLTPESGGLYAISLGLSALYADNHEMLRHGMVMYMRSMLGARRARARPIAGRRIWRRERAADGLGVARPPRPCGRRRRTAGPARGRSA